MRLLVLAVFCWAAMLVVNGCASGSKSNPNSATGGITLEMRVRDTGNMYAAYRVEQDGTIVFSGGRDAPSDRPTWTGTLNAEQIDRLAAALEAHGWFERTPQSVPEPPKRRYEIDVSGPRGRRSYTVKGASPDVEPVHDLLKEFAAARLDAFIDRQPKPGTPVNDQ